MSISYSAYSKYVLCPRMYELHYVERLRPIGTSSALVFGQMVDEALNKVLVGIEPLYFPPELDDVTFMPGDFDGEILIPSEVARLEEIAKDAGYEGDDVLGMIERLLKKSISGGDLTDKQLAVLHNGVELSMLAKTRFIVEAYKEKVMPLIEKVHGVQVPSGPGFIDLVADVKGHGKVILDNKTASRPYESDAVKHSVQLANYANEQGVDKAGFIVIQKTLKKNRVKVCSECEHNGTGRRHQTCPKCKGEWNEWVRPEAVIDVIIDEVTSYQKWLAQKAIQDAELGIKKEVFPANLNQCKFVYGKPCPYHAKCWNNSDEGLEKK